MHLSDMKCLCGFSAFEGILNPNNIFSTISFELNKKLIFKMNFDLGFRVL